MSWKWIMLCSILFLPIRAKAQPCYTYECVIQKVKKALETKNYQAAFDNLESAAAYPDNKPEEIAGLRKQLFDGIQQEKEKAEREQQRAEQAENQVRSTLKIVQQERDRSEALRKAAEMNSEVNRLNALALEAQTEDPTTAARLADYAYKLSGRSDPLAAKLRRNFYGDPNIELYTAKLIGHSGGINSLAFSPDGQLILSGSRDGTARLWDRTGRELQVYSGSGAEILKVDFLPDGSKLLTQDRRRVRLWDLNGRENTALDAVYAKESKWTGFDAASGRIATLSPDNLIRFWDLAGNFLDSIQIDQTVYDVIFSAWGTLVRVKDKIQFFDAAGKAFEPEFNTDAIFDAAFSPSSQHLILFQEPDAPRIDLVELKYNRRKASHALTGNAIQMLGPFKMSRNEQFVYAVSLYGPGLIWDLNGDMLHRFTENFGQLEKELYSDTPGMTAMALSNDNQWAVSGNNTGQIKLWKLDRQIPQKHGGHTGLIWCVAVSADGRQILSGSQDGTVKIWDRQGHLIRTLSVDGTEVHSVSYSDDGAFFAAATKGGMAKLWDAEGFEVGVFKQEQETIRDLAFSPDSRFFITASGSEIVFEDTRTGDRSKLIRLKNVENAAEIQSIDLSPDGSTILLLFDLGFIRLIDLEGNTILDFENEEDVFHWDAAFSPDGAKIATANQDGTITLWSRNGKLISRFEGHKQAVTAISFSPDGRRILSSSLDGALKLWNLEGEVVLNMVGHDAPVRSVAFVPFCPDCPKSEPELFMVSAGDDRQIKGWDEQGRQIMHSAYHSGPITSLIWTSDRQKIISAGTDGLAKIWSTDGQLLQECSGHEAEINALALSPDEQYLLTASTDRTAKLWSTNGELVRTFSGHTHGVLSAAFSPDGKYILTGSFDDTAILWETGGAQVRALKSPGGAVSAVSFSPDGQILLTGSTDSLTLWARSGKMLLSMPVEYGVKAARFSPDGQQVLIGAGHPKGIAKLLDLQGREVESFTHEGTIETVAFSPPCRECPAGAETLILTGGAGAERSTGAIRIWDRSGNEVQHISVPESRVRSATFSADGRQILGAGDNATLMIWKTIDAYFDDSHELTYVQAEPNKLDFDFRKVNNPGLALEYANYQMAMPFIGNNRPDEFESFYKKAEEAYRFLAEEKGPAYTPYLVGFYEKYAADVFARQQFAQAAELYQQALQVDAGREYLYVPIALSHVYAGNWESAKKLLPELLKRRDPLRDSSLAAILLDQLQESRSEEGVQPKNPPLIDLAITSLTDLIQQED